MPPLTLPPPSSFRLDGRRALVIGASSGIGLAAAAALAAAGAAVTLVARRPAELDAASAAIKAAGGIAEGLPLDITDIAAKVAAVDVRGPFDVLVNAAGLARHTPALDTTTADYDAAMALNLRAAHFLRPCGGAGADRGGAAPSSTSRPRWGMSAGRTGRSIARRSTGSKG